MLNVKVIWRSSHNDLSNNVGEYEVNRLTNVVMKKLLEENET